MNQSTKAMGGYEAILRQQLRPGEVLDGVFMSGPDLTVAITSDRLMLMGPSSSNGWELKWIPWRLLAEMLPDECEESSAEESAVHLRYVLPGWPSSRKASRRATDEEIAAGPAEPPQAPCTDLFLKLPLHGSEMGALLRARLARAPSATQ
ncbi:MAG TPA: hypothetical protein VFC51_10560 [Chloroflexota bacterium]|nr:hypothetical protein [Chloroflexota bacterium]